MSTDTNPAWDYEEDSDSAPLLPPDTTSINISEGADEFFKGSYSKKNFLAARSPARAYRIILGYALLLINIGLTYATTSIILHVGAVRTWVIENETLVSVLPLVLSGFLVCIAFPRLSPQIPLCDYISVQIFSNGVIALCFGFTIGLLLLDDSIQGHITFPLEIVGVTFFLSLFVAMTFAWFGEWNLYYVNRVLYIIMLPLCYIYGLFYSKDTPLPPSVETSQCTAILILFLIQIRDNLILLGGRQKLPNSPDDFVMNSRNLYLGSVVIFVVSYHWNLPLFAAETQAIFAGAQAFPMHLDTPPGKKLKEKEKINDSNENIFI